MTQSLKVGITGAGIGGLAAASLLADQSHDITLFDQFEQAKPVGSGLVIQPVGRRVLDVLGAGDDARAMGQKIHRMLGRETRNGHRVLDVSYGQSYGLAIHRAALFQSLLNAAQRRDISMCENHKVMGRDGTQLVFENGAMSKPFDLIIDASGARSVLSPLSARDLPFGAIWTTVDWPDTHLSQQQLTQKYRHANRMIGVMPIGTLPNDSTKKAALFYSLPSDGYKTWHAQGLDVWKAEALKLWPDLAPFLDQITHRDQMVMARYSHGTLRKPYGDAIAYIGDAAHRASPQLGQGANMALLDAWALSEALKHFPIAKALPAYGRARRGHVMAYQAMSAAFTPQYQSHSRILPFIRDRILFPLSVLPPTKQILTALVRGNILPPLGYLTPQEQAKITPDL
ncbi:2-polyprenyl-6-methoxyphenol hydroxylase-like FAD-dependent oxidoreductase [Pacificibacter maritimus]|uniref:2-polyprenyl-6-methoxyphenol hydroxylase-like FAD-dependent oxidoreductase n=1 Tax=Pacificibacter maritimus TaxID=762213 RepID=A0A3N4U8P6_9RHOB|nr:NAD(P)/FAD-dependent oxidoreductase [Pacificibacter maritimus]RPE67116.1 2-polyprenyl-6-methoxyphenol hydroxylase-like FAD-dependent oxidoreductase [Pacificibacter maritimus]